MKVKKVSIYVSPDWGHSWPLQQEEGGGLADRGGHEEAEGGPAPGQGQGPSSPAAGPYYGVETRTGSLSTGQQQECRKLNLPDSFSLFYSHAYGLASGVYMYIS